MSIPGYYDDGFNYDDYYGDITGAVIGAQIAGFVIFCVCFVAFLGLSIFMFMDLMRADKQLPQGQNCMNPAMILVYWLIFLCVGCIGNAIFYFIAKQEIQNRVAMQGGVGGVSYVQTNPAYPQPYPGAQQAYPGAQQTYPVQQAQQTQPVVAQTKIM